MTGVIGSLIVIAIALQVVLGMKVGKTFFYASPLSVISSAIVIPSAVNCNRETRELLTYESTISDILGILAFILLLKFCNPETWPVSVSLTRSASLERSSFQWD